MIVSFDQFVKQAGGKPADVKTVEPQISPTQEQPDYLSRFGTELKGAFGGLQKTTERGAELMQEGKPIQGAVMSGLGAAGGAARAAFSPLTAALEPVITAGLEKSGVLEKEKVQQGLVALDEWSKAHPDAAENLKNIIEVAAFKGAGVIAGKLKPIVGGSITKTKQAVKTGIQTTTSAVKETTEKIPASIMQRVARIPKSQQIKFKEEAGEDVGEYLVKRGIYGDTNEIAQGLYKKFSASKNMADKEIEKLPGVYKAAPIKETLQQLYLREKRVSSPGAFSKDFKRVSALAQKYNKEGLNMSEINEVKRLFERNVKLNYQKSLSAKPDTVARNTQLDTALREWQFGRAKELGLKNLDEINRETRLSKQLLDAIGKENVGVGGNNAITLTDWIVLSGGDPTAISAFLVKKGVSSKKVQSAIAKKLAPEQPSGVKPKYGKPKPGFKEFMKSIEGRKKPQ